MSCYYPNGDLSSADDIPCSNSDACCPLGWSCQSNGLCYLANENYYGRYTCTDQTWESLGCPNICTHNTTATGNEAILECTNGNYCCDANRPTKGCCDTSTDRFQLQDIKKPGSQPINLVTSTSPSLTTSHTLITLSTSKNPSFTKSPSTSDTAPSSTKSPPSSSSTSILVLTSVVTQNSGGASTLIASSLIPIPASTPVITPIAQPSTPSSESKHSGAVIGPAVGASLAAFILIALAVFFFRRRREQKQGGAFNAPRSSLHPMYGEDAKDFADSPYTGKSELEGSPNMAVVPPAAKRNGNENDYHTPGDVGIGAGTHRGVSCMASPTVREIRESHEPTASPSSVVITPPSGTPEPQIDNAWKDDTGRVKPPVELPAMTCFTYKPYRPPGLGVTNV